MFAKSDSGQTDWTELYPTRQNQCHSLPRIKHLATTQHLLVGVWVIGSVGGVDARDILIGQHTHHAWLFLQSKKTRMEN